MSTRQSYQRGLFLIVLGAIASSWIGLGVRLIDSATAWQILWFRSLGVVVLFVVILAMRHGRGIVGVFRKAGLASVIGGIALAMAFSGIIVAIHQATVANAMFLLAASPFMAAVLGRIFLKEHVRAATWAAIVCAFVGVAVTVASGISFGFLWGNVAALIAAVGYALFVIALRWGRLTDMLPVNVIGGGLGMVAAFAVCWVTGVGLDVSLHDALWGLAMGVFQLGLALILITLGARSVPAAEVSLLTLTEVVLAPFWVWLVLGETAGVFTLIGGALVLTAVAGDAMSGLRERRSAAEQIGCEPTVY